MAVDPTHSSQLFFSQNLRSIYDDAPTDEKPYIPLEMLTVSRDTLECGTVLPGGPVANGESSTDEQLSSELRQSDLVYSPAKRQCK